MRIIIQLTERLKYQWPVKYLRELIHKLTNAGHEFYALSDEKNVTIHDTNPRLVNCLHSTDECAKKVIAEADLFVGAPLKYYAMAKEVGTPVVGLLGAT